MCLMQQSRTKFHLNVRNTNYSSTVASSVTKTGSSADGSRGNDFCLHHEEIIVYGDFLKFDRFLSHWLLLVLGLYFQI